MTSTITSDPSNKFETRSFEAGFYENRDLLLDITDVSELHYDLKDVDYFQFPAPAGPGTPPKSIGEFLKALNASNVGWFQELGNKFTDGTNDDKKHKVVEFILAVKLAIYDLNNFTEYEFSSSDVQEIKDIRPLLDNAILDGNKTIIQNEIGDITKKNLIKKIVKGSV